MDLSREELEAMARSNGRLLRKGYDTLNSTRRLDLAAPALALACLHAREYIAYLESLLIDLGHPYDGAEPATPNLLTALEAAGVEMPNGQDV